MDGMSNFTTFLLKGDPNKRKPSDLDNLVKDASKGKNVESFITTTSDEWAKKKQERRFNEIQFVDLEQDTYRTQVNDDDAGDKAKEENECTTESALNQ